MASPDSTVYRLDELLNLAAELGYSARRTSEHSIEVALRPDIVLVFANLGEGHGDSIIGFPGMPWHDHGVLQLMTGESTFLERDELEVLLDLATGALLVVSEYRDGALADRWIQHPLAPLDDLQRLCPGEELRAISVALE